jgi:hypothetical protein
MLALARHLRPEERRDLAAHHLARAAFGSRSHE